MEARYSLEEFLESISRPSTRKNYKFNIERFSKWYGASPEEILKQRQDDWTKRPDENQIDFLNRKSRFEKELLKWHDELMEKNHLSLNSARSYTVSVMQLFHYYDMPIILKNSQKRIHESEMTTRNFPMTIDHIKQMWPHTDLREKVILSLATDLALRISDFINLKKTDIHINEEPPIPIEIRTRKRNVVSRGFISSETVSLLKDYLPTLENSKNPYLFPDKNGTDKGGPISDVWLNELIERLAVKEAKIKLNGKALTFHCFRKMFLSASIDSGVGLTVGKILCGKSVPQSDETYLGVAKWKTQFLKLKEFITIQGQKTESSKIDPKIVEDMNKELVSQRIVINELTNKVNKIQSLKEFGSINDEIIDKSDKAKQKIITISPEEYQQTREFLSQQIKNILTQPDFIENLTNQILNNLDKIREQK